MSWLDHPHFFKFHLRFSQDCPDCPHSAGLSHATGFQRFVKRGLWQPVPHLRPDLAHQPMKTTVMHCRRAVLSETKPQGYLVQRSCTGDQIAPPHLAVKPATRVVSIGSLRTKVVRQVLVLYLTLMFSRAQSTATGDRRSPYHGSAGLQSNLYPAIVPPWCNIPLARLTCRSDHGRATEYSRIIAHRGGRAHAALDATSGRVAAAGGGGNRATLHTTSCPVNRHCARLYCRTMYSPICCSCFHGHVPV